MSRIHSLDRSRATRATSLTTIAAAAIGLWIVIEFAFRRGLAPLLAERLGSGLGADMLGIAIGFPLVAAGIARMGTRVGIEPADWGYRLSLRAVGAGLAGFVAYLVLYGGAVVVYASLPGVQPSTGSAVLGVGGAPLWAAALLLAVNGVVVPVTEELAWRGVIQTALAEAHGTSVAVVVTAVAFVLKHLLVDLSASPLRVTSLVVLAFVLCGLRAKYGTASSTVAHLAANGVATAALVLG